MLGAALGFGSGFGADGHGRRYSAEPETGKGKPKYEKDVLTLFIVARDSNKIDQAVKRIDDFIQDEYYSEVKRYIPILSPFLAFSVKAS